MAFSFKSESFLDTARKIKNIAFENVNASNEILREYSSLILSVKSIFDSGSIDQLEKNLIETKKWDGFDISKLSSDIKNDNLQFLQYSLFLIFIYIKELNFRLGREPDSIIQNFYDHIYKIKSQYYSEFNVYYDFVDELPYRICNEIYSNSKLNEIRIFLQNNDFSTFNEYLIKADSLTNKINSWEQTISERTEAVKKLEQKLDEYKNKYDFVLLNEGFKKLYDQKSKELEKVKDTYGFVAGTMFILPFFEFAIFIGIFIYFKGNMPSHIWLISIPFITLILITFYLVRISLQDKRSIQSQMMQLELRMALCQFIHNYAEDSEVLHKKNKEGFEKFENIIFSPIVASDDKIPTTFDGMEQLAKLIEVVRK